jgi:anti-anti-sigma factor
LSFSIDHTRTGVRFAGEVDRYTADQLLDAISAAIDRVPGEVEVDLTDVTFMDSSGLASIIIRVRSTDHRRLCLRTSRAVQRLLDAAGVSEDVLGVRIDHLQAEGALEGSEARDREVEASEAMVTRARATGS